MSTYGFDLTTEVAHNGTREVAGEVLIDFNRAVDGPDTIGLWPADLGGIVQSPVNIGARHGNIPTVTLGAQGAVYEPGWIDSHSFADDFQSEGTADYLGGIPAFSAGGWLNVKNAPSGAWPNIWRAYAWGNDLELSVWTHDAFRRFYWSWYPNGPWPAGREQLYVNLSGELAVGEDAWHHYAVEWTGAKLQMYFDGVQRVSLDRPTFNTGCNRYFSTAKNGALTDDVQCRDAAPWDGNFSPHRFEQGDCVLGHDFGAAQKLSEVAWTSDEGGWTVSGAGSDFVNGDYVPFGILNGKTYYRKPYEWGYVYLYWDNARWNLQVIAGGGLVLYYGTSLAALPANPWAVDDGTPPAPSLANGYEGDISKMEVYDCDAGAWQQIGGASPTSPITGLDILIADGVTDIVRVTMDPKADALQTETPKLTALTATYEAALLRYPGARRPLWTRRGPVLVPTGVI